MAPQFGSVAQPIGIPAASANGKISPDTIVVSDSNPTQAGYWAPIGDNAEFSYYTEMQGIWNVPNYQATPYYAYTAAWVGLGDTTTVVQDGTVSYNPGYGSPPAGVYWFWEDYPSNLAQILYYPVVRAADEAYANVQPEIGTNVTDFFMEDLTTGDATQFAAGTPDHANDAGDCIFEQQGGYDRDGTIQFQNCALSGVESSGLQTVPLGSLNLVQETMVSNGTVHAIAGSITNGGYNFPVFSLG